MTDLCFILKTAETIWYLKMLSFFSERCFELLKEHFWAISFSRIRDLLDILYDPEVEELLI